MPCVGRCGWWMLGDLSPIFFCVNRSRYFFGVQAWRAVLFFCVCVFSEFFRAVGMMRLMSLVHFFMAYCTFNVNGRVLYVYTGTNGAYSCPFFHLYGTCFYLPLCSVFY